MASPPNLSTSTNINNNNNNTSPEDLRYPVPIRQHSAPSAIYGHQSFLQFINALGAPIEPPKSDDPSILPPDDPQPLYPPSKPEAFSSLYAIHRPVRRAKTLAVPQIKSLVEGVSNLSTLGGSHQPTRSSSLHQSYPSEIQQHEQQQQQQQPRHRQLSEEEAYGAGDSWTDKHSIVDEPLDQSSEPTAATPTSTTITGPPDTTTSASAQGEPSSRVSSSKDARRAILANKLKEIFDLETAEDVLAEYSCWLFRSVFMQGYLYVTKSRLCFFSYLPQRKGVVIRSGSLSKRSTKTRRYTKYWFILKDNVLSWYPSSSNPYFPSGSVDLHYVTSIEASANHPKRFKIVTPDNTHRFASDAVLNRDEWIKTLRKAVFRCQNEGESVKISIPFETIVDIDKSVAEELSSMIRIKVYEGEEGGFALDEFFFSYFSNVDQVLTTIRQHISDFRSNDYQPSSSSNFNSNNNSSLQQQQQQQQRQEHKYPQDSSSSTSTRPLQTTISGPATTTATTASSTAAITSTSFSSRPSTPHRSVRHSHTPSQPDSEFSHESSSSPGHAAKSSISSILKLSSSSSSSSRPSSSSHQPPQQQQQHNNNQPLNVNTSTTDPTHIYPPPLSPRQPPASISSSPSKGDSPWSLASWLKSSNLREYASTSAWSNALLDSGRKVTEIISTPLSDHYHGGQKHHQHQSYLSSSSASKRPALDLPSPFEDESSYDQYKEAIEEEDAKEKSSKLRAFFSLPTSESIILDVHGYLYRSLPIYGRLYVTQNYVCFKATNVLFKTRMLLPICDITALQRLHAFRFGYSTLVLVVRGHEELFFEFSSSLVRNNFQEATQQRMEIITANEKLKEREQQENNNKDGQHLDYEKLSGHVKSNHGAKEAFILRDLEPKSEELLEASTDSSSNQDDISPVMFHSNSSALIDFKPPHKLRFTCLTIGSRGDVQPYIALCKGLMLEGHECKIVTHPEYKDWIQGHGIGFAPVGGDPAELMRICVENGTFTVAFFREGITKFRGWLDDLLLSAWGACQGSDVLIESPSAMAGIHIAEALQIPYFRAFTMPWTRTRTYPHAFGVPERKMGGSFNYMTYVLFESVLWKAIAGQINRWRRDILGLQHTTADKLATHQVPFLYSFSPSVVPPPLDWFEWIHVTGYWFLENPDDSNSKKWEPPESMVKFFDEAKAYNKKIVYIGFGSIVVSDPELMTRTVVEAVHAADVYAIVSKGWSDRLTVDLSTQESKDAYYKRQEKEASMLKSKNIYMIDAVPHDWLFPRMDAVCHHGGSGTTGASLRAGIPTIVRPFFGDQFFWAERIETLGVGSAVRRFTTDILARALRLAVTDERQSAKAKALGKCIQEERGVDKAIQSIYRDLDYARSLVKRDTTLGQSNTIGSSEETQVRSETSEPEIITPEYSDVASTPYRSRNSRSQQQQQHSESSSKSRSLSRHGLRTGASGGGDVSNPGSVLSDDGSWDRISQDHDALSPAGSPFVAPESDEGDDMMRSFVHDEFYGGVESEDDEYNDTDDEAYREIRRHAQERLGNQEEYHHHGHDDHHNRHLRPGMPNRVAQESRDSVASTLTHATLQGKRLSGSLNVTKPPSSTSTSSPSPSPKPS